MKKVPVILFNNIEEAEFLKSEKLLKLNVRYLGTDYELSNYDIYEEISTGDLYATKL